MRIPRERKRVIDVFYRSKYIQGLLEELFSCMFVALSKKGLLLPMPTGSDTAESRFTAEYILERLYILPGGSAALEDLLNKFKKGEVNEKGLTPKEAKKAEEAYEKSQIKQGMVKTPDGLGWVYVGGQKTKKKKISR